MYALVEYRGEVCTLWLSTNESFYNLVKYGGSMSFPVEYKGSMYALVEYGGKYGRYG